MSMLGRLEPRLVSAGRVTMLGGFFCLCLITFAGSTISVLAKPGPCSGPPQDRPAECDDDSSSGEEVTLDILYEFGSLTGGVCSSPDCIATPVTATGTVECGSHFCDFTSTSVVEFFGLPAGLRDLLFATEWRGTPLDPDQCFGSSSADPGSGVALIDNTFLFLRRFHDGETPWDAKVDAVAFDVDGAVLRDYAFNFRGCGASGCGDFAPGSMVGSYEGGALISIGVSGNDKKLKSTPCRCTRSNTPDCPEDVPAPTPPIRITISEAP